MRRTTALLFLCFGLTSGVATAQGMCCSDVGPGGSTVCCPGGLCCGSGACASCRATEPEPPQASYPTCPDTHPVDCGGGKCCGSATPVCCPDSNMCATSAAACAGKVCPATHPVECGSGRCCRSEFPNCCNDGSCCDSAHPYCCGNGRCCDAAHPYCCPGGGCATSLSGCGGSCAQGYVAVSGVGSTSACCPPGYSFPCSDGSCDVTPNCHGAGLLGSKKPPPSNTGGTGGGSGGGGAFNCSPSNSAVTCSTLSACRSCTLQACGGPDGSACAFYKASDGQTFGTGCRANQSCVMSASNDALRYCGCI